MLEQIARHGLIDLDIQCQGDLDIDEHHTIEDVGMPGSALSQAYGINEELIAMDRISMDEARATVALDLSSSFSVFNATLRETM